MDQQLAEILSAIEALTKRVDDLSEGQKTLSEDQKTLAEGQKTLASKEEFNAWTASWRLGVVEKSVLNVQASVTAVEIKLDVISSEVETVWAELKEIQVVSTTVTETQNRLTTIEAELASSNTWFLQMEAEVDRLVKGFNLRENKFEPSAPNFRSRKESLLFSASKMSRGSFKPWDIWGSNSGSNSNRSNTLSD